MHIAGHGDAVKLATAIREALAAHRRVHGHESQRLLSVGSRSLVVKDAVLDRARYRRRRLIGYREA